MHKKALLVLVFALVSALMAMSLTACGPQSDEDKAKAAVDAAVAKATSTNDADLQTLFGQSFYDKITQAGLKPADLAKAFLGSAKVETKDVTVSGNTAVCKASVTNKDISKAIANYQNAVAEWARSDDAMTVISTGGQEALNKKAMELLLSSMNDQSLETKTSDVSIELQKGSNGEWTLSNPNGLTNAMMQGYDLSVMG